MKQPLIVLTEIPIVTYSRENKDDANTLYVILFLIAAISAWIIYHNRRNVFFRRKVILAISTLYKKRHTHFSDTQNMEWVLRERNTLLLAINALPYTKENRYLVKEILDLRGEKQELENKGQLVEAIDYEQEEFERLAVLAKKLGIKLKANQRFGAL